MLENCFLVQIPSQYAIYAYSQSLYAYSLISKFQNLKSQNLVLKYFMTSLLENCFFSMTAHSMHAYRVCVTVCLTVCLTACLTVCLTVCLHSMLPSMPHSMPHSMPNSMPHKCLYIFPQYAYTQCRATRHHLPVLPSHILKASRILSFQPLV